MQRSSHNQMVKIFGNAGPVHDSYFEASEAETLTMAKESM